MFSILKCCLVVVIMFLSLCETSRIKRENLLHEILHPVVKPVVDILYPFRNIPNDPNRFINCPPPTTCPKQITCPPPTACPTSTASHIPATCPTEKNCNEPAPCPSPIICPTSTTCPPPTTCPTPKPCDPPTTCPTPTISTSPPRKESPEERCSKLGAYYCKAIKYCITPRFAKTTGPLARDKCTELNDEDVKFDLPYAGSQSGDFNYDPNAKPYWDCLSAILSPSTINSSELFLGRVTKANDGNPFCTAFALHAIDDVITNKTAGFKIPCEMEHPFYCHAKLGDLYETLFHE